MACADWLPVCNVVHLTFPLRYTVPVTVYVRYYLSLVKLQLNLYIYTHLCMDVCVCVLWGVCVPRPCVHAGCCVVLCARPWFWEVDSQCFPTLPMCSCTSRMRQRATCHTRRPLPPFTLLMMIVGELLQSCIRKYNRHLPIYYCIDNCSNRISATPQ